MHLKLRHTTRYTYDTPVRSVIQVLRVTPRGHGTQHILNWHIDTDHDATLKRSEDSFGNIVHTFWAEGPMDELVITVEGEAITEDASGVLSGTAERLPLGLFLRETGLTTPDAAIRDFARKAAGEQNTLDSLHALMDALSEHMTFEKKVTDPATTSKEAFEKAHGVCQDYAHVFIAAARSLEIPARYVGGYMYQPGEQTIHEAGHGWAEAFVSGLGWVGFDAANNMCPNDAYIRVACGLDYLDAGPVRGVRSGVAEETLDVEVELTDMGADKA
ncbi:transglutaminase domain-containing protein [Tepidamorphus sp. 3E244]|uniref:transglutaminase family protein n=1 Tax=Tepidamorphus sp. 3E244 TaxID=3385498 RepID=UPI0038FD14DE